MTEEIKNYTENLEDLVTKRTLELNKRNILYMTELEMARRVQLSLLPNDETFPKRDEFDFSCKYLAMDKLGGDLFDIIRCGKNVYGFLIADVSGHGVPASLITALAKVSFSANSHYGIPTATVCNNVNQDICKLIGDLEYYLTAYYAILNLETGELQFTNAGHHPAILYRKRDKSITKLDKTGFYIGVFEDIKYETGAIHLEEGDRLLFFTDGIIEIKNKKGEFYQYERLLNFVKNNSEYSPKKFVQGLIDDVSEFAGENLSQDDIAILYVNFLKKTEIYQVHSAEAKQIDKIQLTKEKGSEENEKDAILFMNAIKYFKDSDYSQAISILSFLRKHFPENINVMNNLAMAFYNIGEYDTAISILEKAMEKDIDNKQTLENLSIIKKKLK